MAPASTSPSETKTKMRRDWAWWVTGERARKHNCIELQDIGKIISGNSTLISKDLWCNIGIQIPWPLADVLGIALGSFSAQPDEKPGTGSHWLTRNREISSVYLDIPKKYHLTSSSQISEVTVSLSKYVRSTEECEYGLVLLQRALNDFVETEQIR